MGRFAHHTEFHWIAGEREMLTGKWVFSSIQIFWKQVASRHNEGRTFIPQSPFTSFIIQTKGIVWRGDWCRLSIWAMASIFSCSGSHRGLLGLTAFAASHYLCHGIRWTTQCMEAVCSPQCLWTTHSVQTSELCFLHWSTCTSFMFMIEKVTSLETEMTAPPS